MMPKLSLSLQPALNHLVSVTPEAARWYALTRQLGFTDVLCPEDGFRTSLSTGKPWAFATGCGVYCWIADNGEVYVGQAISARARLNQHWRNHRDILLATFLPTARAHLDERARALIGTIGEHFPLRNIKHALRTAAHVPFDRIVTEVERTAFLSGQPRQAVRLAWRELALLEQKHAPDYARWTLHPEAADAIRSLGLFILHCLPKPAETEARFWSVTLFPQAGSLLGVNVGQQEVFTVIEEDGVFARPLARVRLDATAMGPYYRTDSYDAFVPAATFGRWLTPERLVACRDLVVWLARHTTTLNSGSHCPQIVRAAAASA